MGQTISVSDVEINGFMLSVTTRRNAEDKPELVEELTARSIAAWLWIVNMLESDKWDASVDVPSVEESYAKASGSPITETFGDSRVTIWDTWRSKQRFGFHLNSDDKPQDAVATHRAHVAGIKKAVDKWNADHPYNGIPNRPQNAPQAPNTSATPPTAPDAPATPKNAPNAHQQERRSEWVENTNPPPQKNAPNANIGDAMPLYTKKDAIAKLKPGDKFKMKVVQIEKHSKDGNDYYEFFEPYGGKAGQFSAVSVFVDNEVAVKNGLIGYLGTLNVSMKIPLVGEWVLNCVMGKPKTKTVKGEERTFTSIYVNSFEGQADDDPNQNLSDEIPWTDK